MIALIARLRWMNPSYGEKATPKAAISTGASQTAQVDMTRVTIRLRP
jgi:hypothetical protein